MRPLSWPSANQRLSQVRLTCRRRPIGLLFWPILRLFFLFAHDDADAAERLDDPGRLAAATRMPALHRDRLVNARFLDDQRIDGEITFGREHVLTPVTNAHLVCRIL